MKQKDFLAEFLASQSLARVLRVFIFNQTTPLSIAQIAKRSGVSLAAIPKEIKILEKMEVVKETKFTIQIAISGKAALQGGGKSGTKPDRVWILDKDYVYVRALSTFVHEVSPAQYEEITKEIKRIGKVGVIILSGSFVDDSSRPTDLFVIGDTINDVKLDLAVRKLEPIFGREIRYTSLSTTEFRYRVTVQDRLVRETLDYPHIVLMDKAYIL